MKNILVVGGAGFIGSNLCKRLIEENNMVFCVDNLSTGRLKNLNSVIDHPLFYFGKADILDNKIEDIMVHSYDREHFLGDVKIDEIYHLASPASPPKYQIDPIKTFRINTEGTHKLLEFARRCNARILYTSTSEVYGDPLVHPQTEDYRGNVNTTGPRSCYDEGKRGGETLCADHYRMHGTKVLIARIFNTYGPGMDPEDGRVVSNMICETLKGNPVKIYGTGEQTRSFCYVSDLVEGLIKLMSSNCFAMPINLGNPGEFNMIELAGIIQSYCNYSYTGRQFEPLPIDDPKQRKPDISLARLHLDWEPKVSLEEGLSKTIAYFESELQAKVAN